MSICPLAPSASHQCCVHPSGSDLFLRLKILRCTCIKCGKLLISKEKHKEVLNLPADERWNQVFSLASKIKLLRSHGITRDLESSHDKDNEAWKYKQIMLGYNYRLTDIQAALGISQLQKLNMFIKRRKHLASKYDEELSKLPVRVPYQNSHTDSSYHLYPILIEDETYTRLEIFDKLRASGIGVNVHYIPIHTQPYFEKLGFKLEDFPVSEKYYSKCISLPLYQTMTDDQQNYVIDKLKELLL